MMKRLLGVLALTGGVGLSGCGGNEASSGPPAMQGTVNPSGARSVMNTTLSMRTDLMNASGANVAGQVQSVAISGATQMITPKTGAALTVFPQAGTTGTSGTVTCDAAGCTYDQFVLGGLTYNGGVKSADAGSGARKVTANLTMKGTVGGGGASETIDWTITGDCSISATAINGFFESTGSGTVSAPGAPKLSYTHFNQVKFNSVSVASGVASGGSMYGKWAISVNGTTAGSQAWEGTVTFPQ
jgi:hypothetical protein